ncbi:MAG: PKD domain-containing protein, partial [Candidatus Bathyarchaeia archaeon]
MMMGKTMVVLVLGLLMSGVFTPMIGAVSLVVATDKSSYSKGETMTVSVTGGTGSGIVQLQFNDPSGVKRWAAQDTFTVGGAFVYELKIPDGWSVGSWTVIAKDSTSDATASRAFTITNVAPVADAGPDKSGSVGTVFSFSGAGSTDADGSIVGYAWNFGDLGTGTGVTVTHSYAAVGTYTVTLTVTDDDGATDTDTAVVTVTGVIPPPVNQRPVAMAGADRLLQIGEASTFDGSGSYDLDGVIMSYSWSFGDGQTASGAIVTHSYTLAGRYVSTLTVTDDDGATGTDSVAVTVNAPPVADAGVDQTTTPNTAVNFDGSASKDADGTITAYSWVFGDGASGTGVTTTHTYTALGNYSVTLTVTDNTGATGSDAMMVRVLAAPNQPPVANAGSAKSGHLGEVLTFDGSASRDPDGTIAKYEWEFGDGATAAGAIVTHAYEVEGVYSVRLTVTDNLGAQARATATATITNLPPVARLGGDRHVFTGFTLDFVGSSSSDADGSIAAYAWSFGDGASDSGASVSHTWAAAGSYTVTLTVTDNKGKTGSASVTVTVEDLPVTPKAVEEKQVEANATEQTLDFTEKAESKIRLNTTAPTKVTVIVFPRNPYPVSILPANTIAKYVDVSFSNIDAVKFPIYFEITYTDAEAAGKNPNKFAIYHYKDGAWVKARHTGVDKARKIIWALLDKDEVRGSTFTIAEAPLPPSFTVTELTLAPTQAKTGDSVTVTAKVKNSGELSGAYTADLYVNGAKVDSKTQ